MDESRYIALKERGILFRMNFVSLVGGYGEDARKKAEWLLSKGMIDLTGSDVHRLESIVQSIEKSPRNVRTVNFLSDVSKNTL